MILERKVSFKGVADLRSWISFDQLLSELSARGVSVASHAGAWQRVRVSTA